MLSQCEEIKKEYEAIESLKKEFDLAYEEALQNGNLQNLEKS